MEQEALPRAWRLGGALALGAALGTFAAGAFCIWMGSTLWLLTGSPHSPEVLRSDFEYRAGIEIPPHWQEIHNWRSETDLFGDWSGAVVYRIGPEDVESLLNPSPTVWPLLEGRLSEYPPQFLGGLSWAHAEALDLAPPKDALFVERSGPGNFEETLALDLSGRRLYYYRMSW